MVFFRKTLTRTIIVKPEHLGPKLRQHIKDQCRNTVEFNREGQLGYVVVILSIEDQNVSTGQIDHFTGNVRYEVTFDAILFTPIQGEIIDAIVKECTFVGFWAKAGPFEIHVPRGNVPSDMVFQNHDSTWAKVSSNDDDTTMDPEEAMLLSASTIKKGNPVRLRIVAATPAANTVSALATINEPHLGALVL